MMDFDLSEATLNTIIAECRALADAIGTDSAKAVLDAPEIQWTEAHTILSLIAAANNVTI